MRRLRAFNVRHSSAARVARAFIFVSVIAALLQSCERKEQPRSTAREEERPRERVSAETRPSPTSTPPTRRIMAAWYPVPPNSLAKRRAPEELTAAHNTLPLGTRVRVTNPDNGRSLIVRITDRGIRDRRVKLDLCKEAAAELGMVREGFADLKMQVLREDQAEEGAVAGAQSVASQQ
jgi:rare lipoprotein A (peptidoglycan hydrolase)